MQAEGNYILGAESCDLAFATAIEGSLNVESTEVVKGEAIVCNYSLNINQKFIKILTGSLIAQTELPEGLNVKKITVDGIEINNYSITNSILKIPINIQNEDIDEANEQKAIEIKIELSTDKETSAEEFNIEMKAIADNITLDSNNITIKLVKSTTTTTQEEVSVETGEEEIKYNESILSGKEGTNFSEWSFSTKSLTHSHLDSMYYFCRQHGNIMPSNTYKSSGTSVYSGEGNGSSANWWGCYYSYIFSQPITSSCHSSDYVQKAIWATSLNTGAKTSSNYINNAAYNYAEYKTNYVKPAFNKNTKLDYSIENMVGPFQVEFNYAGDFGGISTIKLYAENGTEITSKWTIANKEGQSTSIKSNTDFYIKFDDINSIIDDGICKLKLKITFKKHYSTYAKIENLYGSKYYSYGQYLTCESCSPDGVWIAGTPTTTRSSQLTLNSYTGNVTTVIKYRKYGNNSPVEYARQTGHVSSAADSYLVAKCSKCGFYKVYYRKYIPEHQLHQLLVLNINPMNQHVMDLQDIGNIEQNMKPHLIHIR